MVTGQGDSHAQETHARWAVVMTVREPVALVEANVRWHLAAGAHEVFVFLDDPQDSGAARLSKIKGCHVQLCDAAYWTQRRPQKGRPPSQMRRQTINANVAQRRTDAAWLFHIDADEFIWQDGDLGAELALLTDPGTELNLPVLERLFPQEEAPHVFAGAFRVTGDLSEADAARAYAPFERFMKRGQYSHGAGKSGVRVGAGLRLGVHNATVRRGDTWRRAPKQVSRSARLLHFDGLTPLHWAMKFLRYQMTSSQVQSAILQPHRAAQIEWMMDRCNTMAQIEAAHRTLFALDPARVAQLSAFDLLAEVPFDPQQIIGVDLSPAAFDADLLVRNPWLSELLDAG
ncbi:glycosyltransferase family 2 protein [uncultured Tateyamaria sp.]|uniref:glycosyltransferase family 2 protein n=1 Tax=uncultured Tateyamaria sp. TaxID=455651 RepID=UPI0026229B43|nr:glycosyltransferase family 2 protein [uncultured Tateyamaria sp.]